MSNTLIAVSHDTSIPLVEYQDQPVVTLAMVDKVHCRTDGTASRAFNTNRKHFTEGEDFYRVDFSQNNEFRSFGISIPPRGIIVLTESGYLLLVKSFTDDMAWQVQKQLVKVYFRAKAALATTAEPVREPNYLTNADNTNLARLVWQCTNDRRYGKAWNFSIWKDLRRVTRTQSPARFEVEHLPVLAAELERIYTAATLLDDAVRRCEVDFLRRVFRQGEDAAAVVAELEVQILKTAASEADSFRAKLAEWQRSDVQALRNRGTPGLGLEHYPGALESAA